MKLISCYISGFGRIRDFSYTFAPGLNAILEENGAGKTTLCVFIKSMFYGMEYNGRRKGLMERGHYAPWEGGVYGGSLDFATAGRRYRVERTFGRKDKDDTFRLIDLDTMQESEDYSSNLGEELFEVDRESFEKSIFIPQEALATNMTDSFNAHIGNGVSSQEDVVRFDAALDAIDKTCRNYTRNSKTNTGRRVLLQREIRFNEELADRIPAAEEEIRLARTNIGELRTQLGELAARKAALADQIVAQGRREQRLGEYRAKQQQLAAQEEELKELRDFFAVGVPTPEEISRIADTEHELTLKEKELAEREAKLPRPEYIQTIKDLFPEEVPSEEQFAQWKGEAAHLRELAMQRQYAKMSDADRQRLQELETYFIQQKPSEEEMQAISQEITELAKQKGQTDEAERHLKEAEDRIGELKEDEKKSRNGIGLVITVFLVAVLILGGLVFFRMHMMRGMTLAAPLLCFAAAACVAIAACAMRYSRRRRYAGNMAVLQASYEQALATRDAYVKRQQASRKLCEDFLSRYPVEPAANMQQQFLEVRQNAYAYEQLKEQEARAIESSSGAVDALADASMGLYTVLQPYADRYGIDLFHDGGVGEFLERLEEDAATYRNYVLSVGRRDELKAQAAELNRRVSEAIRAYPIGQDVQDMGRQACLDEIRKKADRYQDCKTQEEQTAAELRELSDQISSQANTASIEELQKQQQDLDAEAAQLTRRINAEEADLNTLLEEMDGYEAARDKLSGQKEQLRDMERHIHDLELAQTYLRQARKSFITRYLGPLQVNMQRYIGMLTRRDADSDDVGSAAPDGNPETEAAAMDGRHASRASATDRGLEPGFVSLDMNLEPKVTVRGHVRDSQFFSTGQQDLLALCSRFALIDVLYPHEQPMIILDDAFANLDASKIGNAMALLEEVSAAKQIIYFTCHASRMPQGADGC